MLRTRIWMGAVLILLGIAMLVVDQWLAPYYPFLLLLMLGLCQAGCYELLHLLPLERRPPAWLCYLGIAGVIGANWPPKLMAESLPPAFQDPWRWIAAVLAVIVLGAFLMAMAHYREADEAGHS